MWYYFFIGGLIALYFLLSGLAYSTINKIFRKYRNYPHLDNLPQKWESFIRKDRHKWNQGSIKIGCFLKFPFKAFVLFGFILGAALIMLITSPLKATFANKILKVYARKWGFHLLKLLYRIKQPSDINQRQIKTPLMISNHVCWFDTIYMLITFYPISFLAKAQVRKTPVIKTIVDHAQCVYIERQSQTSRESIIQNIKDRIESFIASLNKGKQDEVFPLIIFPEGTTSNGTSILSFKSGAFNDMAPITVLSFNYKCDNFDFGMVELTQGEHMILTLCMSPQLEVKFSEITPNSTQTSESYCASARKLLAEMTGFKTYECGYRERKKHQTMINEAIHKQKQTKRDLQRETKNE